jgi:hypothetical protein
MLSFFQAGVKAASSSLYDSVISVEEQRIIIVKLDMLASELDIPSSSYQVVENELDEWLCEGITSKDL